MALVTRVASPFQTVTAGGTRTGRPRRGSADSQNWSKFDDPQVDQLFIQAAQALNPVTGGTIYAQIDDQLWDQMVALPLFGEPALVANGVQVAKRASTTRRSTGSCGTGPVDHAEAGAARTDRAVMTGPGAELRRLSEDSRARYHASRPDGDIGATSSEWRNRQTR